MHVFRIALLVRLCVALGDVGPEILIVPLLILLAFVCWISAIIYFSAKAFGCRVSVFSDPKRGEVQRPVDRPVQAVAVPLRVPGRVVGQSSAQSQES